MNCLKNIRLKGNKRMLPSKIFSIECDNKHTVIKIVAEIRSRKEFDEFLESIATWINFFKKEN